ncbi:MAG: efflux RND transporter periplasmic adaptor subunit [Arenicellales bacterium]
MISALIDAVSARKINRYTLFLCLILFYCDFLHAQQRQPTVVVEIAQEVSLVEEVSLSGSVISQQIANLSTEASGIVERIEVEVGDQVKAGDLILKLNSDLSELSVDAARAETNQAVEELDDARRRLADAKLLAQSSNLSVNEVKSLASRERINIAGVERFRASQKRQEAQLERHSLRAPFGGVISRKQVEQGEWITPGQAVVELVASENLLIEFQAPQDIYSRLGKVSAIYTTFDALPDQVMTAHIETVIPIVNPTTRTFIIRTALDYPNAQLAPGMSASAVLNLSAGSRGVVINRDALIRYPDGRVTIWVVNQEGDQTKVQERRVEIGYGFEGKIAIKKGLSAGSRVVVRGNEGLRDGQIVTIKPSD